MRSCGERKPPVDPRRLRSSVTVQRLVDNPTRTNGEIDRLTEDNWTPRTTLRAAFESGGGGESEVGEQMQGVRRHTLWTRYSAAAAATSIEDRLVFGERILQVTNVTNLDERSQWLRIEAMEVAS